MKKNKGWKEKLKAFNDPDFYIGLPFMIFFWWFLIARQGWTWLNFIPGAIVAYYAWATYTKG